MTQQLAGLAHDRYGAPDVAHTVIAVHGVGHDRTAWRPVAEYLDRAIGLVAVDLPGHGDSPLPPASGPWDVARLTSALRAFVAELGLPRPVVVGNSLGAAIGLELARSGEARAAVALAPTGYWSALEVRYAVGLLRASHAVARVAGERLARWQTASSVRAVTLAPYSAHPRRVDPAIAADAVRAFAGSVGLRPITARSAGYRAVHSDGLTGSVIAWGSRDRLLVGRQRARSFRAVPNARHVVLGGGGHVPMFDVPQAVAALIAQTVLNGTPIGGRA